MLKAKDIENGNWRWWKVSMKHEGNEMKSNIVKTQSKKQGAIKGV